MTEEYIRKNPNTVRRISDDGYLVCNHTAHHKSVSRMTLEKIKEELKGVEDAYREVTGRELAKYFRPPQGQFSEEIAELHRRAWLYNGVLVVPVY